MGYWLDKIEDRHLYNDLKVLEMRIEHGEEYIVKLKAEGKLYDRSQDFLEKLKVIAEAKRITERS